MLHTHTQSQRYILHFGVAFKVQFPHKSMQHFWSGLLCFQLLFQQLTLAFALTFLSIFLLTLIVSLSRTVLRLVLLLCVCFAL